MSTEVEQRAKLFLTSDNEFDNKMSNQIETLGLIKDALSNIKGADGLSPTIDIEEVTTADGRIGHLISVTDARGQQSPFTIYNGVDGLDGLNGLNGIDGLSTFVHRDNTNNCVKFYVTEGTDSPDFDDLTPNAVVYDGTVFDTGNNIQLSDGVLSTKDTQVVTVDCTNLSSFTATDEKIYVLNNISSIELSAEGDSERHFFVVCGDVAPTITTPEEWGIIIFNENQTVEISVLNGKAVAKQW